MMKKRELRFEICIKELIYQKNRKRERDAKERKRRKREIQEKPIKNGHIRVFY